MADTMDLWASRVKNADPATYVGQQGRIFYYPDSGTLRISDGSTPGGLPINLTGNIGDLAFGNFIFSNNTMTISTVDGDLTIEGNGNGNVLISTGGNVNFSSPINIYPNGNLLAVPSFSAGVSGNITIVVQDTGVNSGVNIIGTADGTELVPTANGVMLQITGRASEVSRVYIDAANNYPVLVGRRYNGTPTSPTAVLAEQTIARLSSNSYDGTGFADLGVSRIDIVAEQNHTAGARGTRMEFWTVPNNTATLNRQMYVSNYTLYANNVQTSGNVVIKSNVASNVGVLQITNNSTGNIRYPGLANVLAQFTGQDNKTPYIVFDGYGNVNSTATAGEFTFRTARGNLAVPAAVQNNDPLGKIGGAGWGATGYGGVFASSMEFQAAGTFTDSSRPGKLVFKAIPDASITPSTVLTMSPTAATWNDGLRMSNAWVTLAAGTATEAPLKFTTAAALLTTSTPGAMNYDGTVFYATPLDLERGIIPAQQQFVLNATRNLTAGTTAAQSMFGVSVGLSANTRYYYEINALFAKNGSSSNQPTINYGINPSAGSLYSHFYTVNSSVTSTLGGIASGSQMFNYITTGFNTGVPITAAMPINVSYARILVKGYIDVNTAATLDFQLAFSDAPNTSASVQPKSGIYIYPVGPAGANTSVGTWV